MKNEKKEKKIIQPSFHGEISDVPAATESKTNGTATKSFVTFKESQNERRKPKHTTHTHNVNQRQNQKERRKKIMPFMFYLEALPFGKNMDMDREKKKPGPIIPLAHKE